jgi:hypothetical protein
MSTFDISTEAPGMLRAEAANMSIKFDKTSPTTARISWNIPAPAAGCAADSRAYNGIVVTIDTTPTNASKLPAKGSAYEADITIDANLFAGSNLGTSMVVGAFYNDVITTFVDVTGLKPNTPYYVTGFPVDAQLRYYIEGIHAYSLDTTNRGSEDTNGTQVVVLNPYSATMGMAPADLTGLQTTQSYDFTMQVGVTPRPQGRVDSVDCVPAPPSYTITIDGALAQTYQELTTEIMHQLATINGVQQSPTAPNAGTYYWNSATKKLFVWNGSANVEVPGVIAQSTSPDTVVTGTYWYNPTTNTLKAFDGITWVTIVVMSSATDPASPAVGSAWFDGTTAYTWNGVTWCVQFTLNQTTDPTFPTHPAAGSFWYDTSKEELLRWNDTVGMWTESTAVQSAIDPNVLPVGSYWFNDATNQLFAYNTPAAGWNIQTNVSIAENEPSLPGPGKFWYNPIALELKQRNVGNTAWVVVDVVPFPADPTVRSFCDVWWNTATSELFVWNGLTSAWVQVTSLYMQGVDPTLPIQYGTNDAWFNPTTGVLSLWNGYCFVPATFVQLSSDPTTTIAAGTAWHNTSTNTWSLRSATNTWDSVSPVVSSNDPRTLPTNTMWFNTSVNALAVWNGIAWVNVSYVTTPISPTKGALWYDLTQHVLKMWNGDGWVIGMPIATCEMDCHGNILFTDTRLGSLSFIGLTDGTLFKSLSTPYNFHDPKPGVDGASDTPTWMEVGIGTDGSKAERLLLQNEIRYELGYPVVDVEITPEQMDYIVDKSLSELRTRSGIAYKRGFFFMNIHSETQVYYLTNKISGMNKIVDILGVYRATSSFLSSAHGAGVYGQIVMQHLYNMGTFDLLSYHLMSEYTKLMEMLFAARITFTWNEQKRELFIHHRFPMNERMVCIEATTERTEQDLLTDRYTRAWLRRYSCATARLILAETRGKFSSLPGAGGAVTLNASDLRQAAQQEIEACLQEIDDFIADKPDEYGMGCQFVFG